MCIVWTYYTALFIAAFQVGCIDGFVNGTWKQLGQTLSGEVERSYDNDNDGRYPDKFGTSVANSADGLTIAVAAVGINYGAGHIEVYRFNATSDEWDQRGSDIKGYIKRHPYDDVVAMSDDGTTIVGGSVNGVSVFKYNSSMDDWEQVGQDLYNRTTHVLYGGSLDMSADGSVVAVYFYKWDNVRYKSDGIIVRVFEYSELSSQWEQVGSDIGEELNLGNFDHEKTKIDLSGDGTTVAISTVKQVYTISSYDDPRSYYEVAAIHTYRQNRGSDGWAQIGTVENGYAGEQYFGKALSLSADGSIMALTAAIIDHEYSEFAPFNATLIQKGRGRVYKLNLSSLQWEQIGDDLEVVDLAITLSSDGNSVALGTTCPYEIQYCTKEFQRSCVSIYKFDPVPSRWYPIGVITTLPRLPPDDDDYVNPCYQGDDDLFGRAIGLSADGTIIAIGAPGNGDFANYVEVFQYEPAISGPTFPVRTPVATKAPILTNQPVTIAPVNVSVRTPIIAPVRTPRTTTKLPSRQPNTLVPVMSPLLSTTKTPTSTTTTLDNCTTGNATAVVKYNLYDSRTDTIVVTITNGTIISHPPPMNRTNIEAVIPCNDNIGAMRNSTVVEIQLYNHSSPSCNNNTAMIHHRIERYSKYFLFGDNGRNIYNGRIVPGTYQIRVIVNQTRTSPFTTFTIV